MRGGSRCKPEAIREVQRRETSRKQHELRFLPNQMWISSPVAILKGKSCSTRPDLLYLSRGLRRISLRMREIWGRSGGRGRRGERKRSDLLRTESSIPGSSVVWRNIFRSMRFCCRGRAESALPKERGYSGPTKLAGPQKLVFISIPNTYPSRARL